MSHPSLEQLQRFLADEEPSVGRARLENHVNRCEKCLDQLEILQRSRQADLKLLAELLLHPPAEVRDTARAEGEGAPPGMSPGSTTSPDALPGSGPGDWPTFDGYEILDRVGHGGMGEVYKARQRRTNRIVALKTVLPGLGVQTPEAVERLTRFRTEA